MSPSGIPYFILLWPRVTKDCPNTIKKQAGTPAWEKEKKKRKKKRKCNWETGHSGHLVRLSSGGPLGRSSFPANASILRLLLTALPGGSSSLTDKIKLLKWNLIWAKMVGGLGRWEERSGWGWEGPVVCLQKNSTSPTRRSERVSVALRSAVSLCVFFCSSVLDSKPDLDGGRINYNTWAYLN